MDVIDITPDGSVSPVFLVEPTDDVLAFRKEQEEETKNRLAEFANQQAAKDSAVAKLAKLGLTVEEVQSLISTTPIN